MAHEITAIRMSPGGTLHEHITDYKWRNRGSGSTGQSNKPTMVDWIDNKSGVVAQRELTWAPSYVGSGASQARVGAAHPTHTKPYLRTYADGQWNNNLLSLPRF